MNKILVVSRYEGAGRSSYYQPFSNFGEYVSDIDLLDDPKVVLVVFTGGEDVTPSLYGEKAHRLTDFNVARDQFEVRAFQQAKKLGKNIAGICRGSQLICALSGGKLVQHITGHGGNHNVRTDDGRLIEVSSTHHQMQLPPPDAVPIAWAEPKRSGCYHGAPGVEYTPDREHDVVWYPSTNALGMQYHPEFMREDSEGYQYCEELIERFFRLPRVA